MAIDPTESLKRFANENIDPTVKTPKFWDIVIQIGFLSGLFAIAGTGIVLVIPYQYNDDSLKLKMQMFAGFLVFQIIMNWICMKFTDTSYVPSRHGAIPDGISIGQDISQAYNRINGFENGETMSKVRKDASVPKYIDSQNQGRFEEKPTSKEDEKDKYPHLSWTPCLPCNRPMPPRCHHCPSCNKCFLKRDHHCFFVGTCIGFRTLRHFTVFVFWSMVATLFASYHALPFWYNEILLHTSFFDLFVPLAFVRAILGYIEWKFVTCIVLGWLLLLFLLVAKTYLQLALRSIMTGKTSYELEEEINVIDKRPPNEKFEAVFGKYVIFNFIVPLHFMFEPIEDPVRWPFLSVQTVNN